MEWIVDITLGLRSLGGEARLPHLYVWIKRNRAQLPPNWDSVIRATLQAHCSTSKQFQPGNTDIFRNTGRGWWAIRKITDANTVRLPLVDLRFLTFQRMIVAGGVELAEARSLSSPQAFTAFLDRRVEGFKRWLLGGDEPPALITE
jgi:hypothetical protein